MLAGNAESSSPGKKNCRIQHSKGDPASIERYKDLESGSKEKGINLLLLFGFNTSLAVLGPIPMTLNYPGSPAVTGPMFSSPL